MLCKSNNILLLAAFFGKAAAAAAADHDHYTPTRISYDDLVSLGRGEETTIDTSSKFWKTLHEVGMVSITDIPNFNKKALFGTMEDCIHNRKEITPPEFLLDGGTKRVTVATQTIGSNVKDLLVGIPEEDQGDDACPDFQKESNDFRASIQMVSNAFASSLGVYSSGSVMTTNDGQDMNIQDVVTKGNHLEHFHSYYTDDDSSSLNTIDWHTDQGLMLLFTPGQQDDKVTGGFLIIKDKSAVEVDFDESIDDVVIMLGDGIDQYFNDDALRDLRKDLRAVPHALTLPATSESSGRPRIWYGRMVLPPSNAIVPASIEMMERYPNAVPYTFEDMRKGLITGEDKAMNLGCSNPNQVAVDVSRRLGVVGNFVKTSDPSKWQKPYSLMPEGARGVHPFIQCGKGTYEGLELPCWQRCMDFNNTEYKDSCASPEGCNEFYNGNPNDITPEKCNSVGLTAMCMDDDNHEWIMGYHNHDYYLQCGRPDTVIQATLPPTRFPTGAPTTPVPTTMDQTEAPFAPPPKHSKKSKKYGKAYRE